MGKLTNELTHWDDAKHFMLCAFVYLDHDEYNVKQLRCRHAKACKQAVISYFYLKTVSSADGTHYRQPKVIDTSSMQLIISA